MGWELNENNLKFSALYLQSAPLPFSSKAEKADIIILILWKIKTEVQRG
jgi:hypothetical protein